MNGILVVNKEKDYTSRDVVNIVSKKIGTKKIGHTGTLDPLATGVLVLCIGKALKVAELITAEVKEYEAEVVLGIETDTLDITGKITNKKEEIVTKERLIEVLKSFQGKYLHEVPLYSAVKVNGKRLYEYARNNIEVELPKKEVEIFDLELISDIDNNCFKIKCLVSKGTYIRSLIRDIGHKLGTYATMKELNRTKQGQFMVENSFSLKDIDEGKYELLEITDVIDLPKVIVDEKLEKKIKNGMILEKFFEEEKVFILNNNHELLAIYHQIDNNMVKPWKMF